MTRRIVLLSVLALICIGWFGHSSETVDRFMALDEIQAGMEGIGKTIIKGTEIRSFPVKVIGVIDNPGDLDDHIIVRASGDVIREAGGIAAGMSGSPIYINDKLIGALWGAASFDISNTPIALIRPIATMLKMANSIRSKAEQRALNSSYAQVPAHLGQIQYQGVQTNVELTNNLPTLIKPNTLYVQPMMTPVMVSGVSGRAMEILKNGISDKTLQSFAKNLSSIQKSEFLDEMRRGLEERYNIKLMQSPIPVKGTATAYTTESEEPFEEGGALSALLTYGDISLGAIGTISYVDGPLTLAFGHPFLFDGDVEFFLSEATILDTVESLQTPWKLGVPTKARGAVLEDRMQGIGGMVGVEPRHIDVEINVTNKDQAVDRTLSYQIGYYENLVPFLLFASLLQAMDDVLNRIGPGTMKISYSLKGRGMPKTLTHDDVFASFADVAVAGPLRAAQVLFLITRNEFIDPELEKVSIDIELTPEVRALRVKSIKTDKEKYKAGEAVKYTATLQAYRGKEESFEGTLELPTELEHRSNVTVRAFGGSSGSQRRGEEESPEFESLDDLVEALDDTTSNDWITIEFLGFDEDDNPRRHQTKDSKNKNKKSEIGGKISDRQRKDGWFIYGEKTFEIEIEDAEKNPTEEEPAAKPVEPEKKPEEQKQPPNKKCQFLFYC